MSTSRIRLANEAWEAFFRAQATLALEFERDGDWGDLLPREYGVLYALSTAPDGMRMCDLCDDVLLTQAGISRLVARLEKRGMVERGDDPDDARARRIRLTARGAQEQRRVGHAHARHVATAMARALDPDQLETLTGLSRALLAASPDHRRKGTLMNDLSPKPTAKLVVVSAGVSDPSSTRLLADRTAQKTVDTLTESGLEVTVTVIDLGPIAVDIAQSIVAGFPRPKVQDAIERLAEADAIIASTPVYKAGISGLFKSFADLIDDDVLIAKPVILAATGGTARHAMVVDEQMRPLFAFLRAIPVPTSLYAAPEDWGSVDLGTRIARAATELALILRSGAPRDIAEENWDGYQHQFAGNATRATRSSTGIDFSSDLMRLAAGGSV